jgi:hypothetical protein
VCPRHCRTKVAPDFSTLGGIKGILIATVAGSWDEPIGVALPAWWAVARREHQGRYVRLKQRSGEGSGAGGLESCLRCRRERRAARSAGGGGTWGGSDGVTLRSSLIVPAMIAEAGDRAARRFLDFFAASIENDNTRLAYYRAVLVLRLARAAWPRRARRYRAVPRRRLFEGTAGVGCRRSRHQRAHGLTADGETASGGDPHAVRLARRRPGPCD